MWRRRGVDVKWIVSWWSQCYMFQNFPVLLGGGNDFTVTYFDRWLLPGHPEKPQLQREVPILPFQHPRLPPLSLSID
jgi:hypothetical protein